MPESEFTRGFRLHPRSGPALDGAAFPSARVFVLDDPEHGLATVAVSLEELLRGGYDGARIEWADGAWQRTDAEERPEDAARRFARRLNAVERLCSGRPGYHTVTVKALLSAMSDTDDGAQQPEAEADGDLPPCGDREHRHMAPCARYSTEPTRRNQPTPAPSETGLPPAQPCTDPRHTGPIRERLGCTGPDPATT